MFRTYKKWREGETRLERWLFQSRVTKEESHEKSRLEWWWKMEVLAGIEVVISSTFICCRFFYFMMNENFLSAYFTSSSSFRSIFFISLHLLFSFRFLLSVLLFNSVSRSITSCQIIHEWQIILQNVTFSQPWLAHTFLSPFLPRWSHLYFLLKVIHQFNEMKPALLSFSLSLSTHSLIGIQMDRYHLPLHRQKGDEKRREMYKQKRTRRLRL